MNIWNVLPPPIIEFATPLFISTIKSINPLGNFLILLVSIYGAGKVRLKLVGLSISWSPFRVFKVPMEYNFVLHYVKALLKLWKKIAR